MLRALFLLPKAHWHLEALAILHCCSKLRTRRNRWQGTENARRNTAASLARAHDIFLSVINLALWSYNLFVFLLLRVLPIYFDKIKTPPVDMAYTVVPIPKTNAN